MKTRILVLCLFVSTFSFAQKVQFGIKAGANLSNFSGGDFNNVDKKAMIGFHGGGYLNFSFLNFALQPELLVSTQGAKIDSVSGSYKWKLTYITLPVMFMAKLGTGFYVEAVHSSDLKLMIILVTKPRTTSIFRLPGAWVSGLAVLASAPGTRPVFPRWETLMHQAGSIPILKTGSLN